MTDQGAPCASRTPRVIGGLVSRPCARRQHEHDHREAEGRIDRGPVRAGPTRYPTRSRPAAVGSRPGHVAAACTPHASASRLPACEKLRSGGRPTGRACGLLPSARTAPGASSRRPPGSARPFSVGWPGNSETNVSRKKTKCRIIRYDSVLAAFLASGKAASIGAPAGSAARPPPGAAIVRRLRFVRKRGSFDRRAVCCLLDDQCRSGAGFAPVDLRRSDSQTAWRERGA
jgi:hypothetical protein